AGAEVAQVYVGMPSAIVPEPPKQLKAFRKVILQPGETSHVSLTLDQSAYAYWDVNSHSWMFAPGTYQILIGSSSREIRLQASMPAPGDATSVQQRPWRLVQ